MAALTWTSRRRRAPTSPTRAPRRPIPQAEKDTYSFAYKVHPDQAMPADHKPSTFRWWAIPRETDMNRFKGRTDMGTRTEYKGEFAFYLGEGDERHFRRDEPATIEIVCELIDANKNVVDVARYQQVIMGHRELETVKQIDKLEAEAVKNYAKIQKGKATGLKAMHFDVRRNKTEDLQLFLGPSAANPTKTMLLDLTPGAEYVEHEGADVTEAISHLESNNSYSTGEILIQIEGEAQPRRFKTKGESDLADAAGKTGIGSMGLLALGIIAAAIPGVDIAAPFLITAGLGAGAASAGMSLADELRKAKPSPTAILLDITAIVGSFMGAGSTIQAVRMGSVELALATATGRFFIYTGFAFDAAGGILLAADTAEKIEQIRDSQMPEEEKIKAIEKLLAMAVITGGLIAFGGSRDRQREDARGYGPGRGAPVRGCGQIRSTRSARSTTRCSRRSRRSRPRSSSPSQRPWPRIRAPRRDSARPSARSSSPRCGRTPSARSRRSATCSARRPRACRRTRSAAPAARTCTHATASRGSRRSKQRFERGVKSTKAGRVRGATVDNIKVDVKTGIRDARALRSAATRWRSRSSSRRPPTLSKGPHAATGGAGAGRIVELKPPASPGDKWTAHVELDAATLQDDVKFVLGHELDEIAEFIATKGRPESVRSRPRPRPGCS